MSSWNKISSVKIVGNLFGETDEQARVRLTSIEDVDKMHEMCEMVDEGSEIAFVYHGIDRSGTVDQLGIGSKGPFMIVRLDTGGQDPSGQGCKAFSYNKIENLRIRA